MKASNMLQGSTIHVFNKAKTYIAGDLCFHEGQFWKCHSMSKVGVSPGSDTTSWMDFGTTGALYKGKPATQEQIDRHFATASPFRLYPSAFKPVTVACLYCKTVTDSIHQCPNCGAPK